MASPRLQDACSTSLPLELHVGGRSLSTSARQNCKDCGAYTFLCPRCGCCDDCCYCEDGADFDDTPEET